MGSDPETVAPDTLPVELRALILSHLSHADLGRALCVSKALASVSRLAWEACSRRRWPDWAAIAAEPDAQWRRVYELLTLREAEAGRVVDVQAIRKMQGIISERHRAILTEWMCEVSSEWELESAIVFKAVECLDNYLAQNPVDKLTRFQLVGMACLRATMGDAACQAVVGCSDKMLDPQRFAYISDNTYTTEEVEDLTKVVAAGTPAWLKSSPNSKMFLRSFWHRATQRGVVAPDEMHVYTCASFLLQLALLDLPCAAFPPSLVAAAALSLALTAFGKPAWPAALQRFGSYLPADLEPCRQRLAVAQASHAAPQLRRIWRAQAEAHGYVEFQEEWAQLLEVVATPAPLLPGVGPEPPTPDHRDQPAAAMAVVEPHAEVEADVGATVLPASAY